MALHFVDTAFENASPANWHVDEDGVVHIALIYDHERSSPNRANGHWHVRVEADPGQALTVLFENFANVWNGKIGSPIRDATTCMLSNDGKCWRHIPGEKTSDNKLRVEVTPEGSEFFLARVEPYRLSDLYAFLNEIRHNPRVDVMPIGHTAEERELEIVRVGAPSVSNRVLLRARSHPWEPGGNWVLQGLVRELLGNSDLAKQCQETFCTYLMPMANKDGVARGYTRFNVRGMDLNRDWDRPADPTLAPENCALEGWLDTMAASENTPQLAIDFHNDGGGNLHVSRPELPDVDRYLACMGRLEELLRKHTWFTEGSTGSNFHNPGTFGEGLLGRYGIDACILELNCNTIAGLGGKSPTGGDWEAFGRGLCKVFLDYFE